MAQSNHWRSGRKSHLCCTALLFDECHSSKEPVVCAAVFYFCTMVAYLRRHPWYVLFGMVAAAVTAAALLRGNYNEMYFSIAIKPGLFLYYFAICIAGFYLLDHYLFVKRYVLYACFALLLLSGSAAVAAALSPIIFLGEEGYSFFLHLIGIATLLGISAFIRLLKDRIVNKTEYNEYKARRVEAELKLLKQQLNPHFLFNTLNSVYAQCLDNRQEAADMVLQLSDMLRYQLETDKQSVIPLRDEVSFIESYIFFEKRRLPKGYQVTYSKEIDDESLRIAPLLLITLIENCFKHGVRLGGEHMIDIYLTVSHKKVRLHTTNPVETSAAKPSTKIGLQNLRRRLQLLYPQRFVLETNTDKDLFNAQLEINL